METSRAYIGVGANLGDREATIAEALARLGRSPGIEVVAVSTLRETEPWGPVPQPAFLNGAVALETTLSPRDLLDALLAVERSLGRVRGERWGPRVIDLDLLLHGQTVLAEPGLELPHPRLHERAFALEPLVELDPTLVVPGSGTVGELLAGIHSGA